jgi:GT2 family glycosyltransferase
MTSCPVSAPFPDDLELSPVSRWPTVLKEQTVRTVLEAPLDGRIRQVAADRTGPPFASIVIVTFDGLLFTRLCLETLLMRLPPGVEIVIVDNGSTDGTVEYLSEVGARDRRVRVELSGRNVGFAAATNHGVGVAHGARLVLLNNDTIASGDAIDMLIAQVADPCIGLLGAVSNRAGNEAEIDVPYRTFGELERFALGHADAHAGERFDIRTATMFCAALRREVWNEVGPLDERFEIGLFEDDDYAMRVRRAGYRVMCAEDVFVHHFGQASIGRLGPTGEYGALFHDNRRRWEAKWGVPWEPYERRVRPAYQALVERIRRIVCETVAPEGTVLVLSKGDAELLKLENRRAWHFPQGEDGNYAGHYPANSEECIAELERMRAKGAEFLAVPAPAMWWLSHYEGFHRYLETHCSDSVLNSDCSIFRLGPRAPVDR